MIDEEILYDLGHQHGLEYLGTVQADELDKDDIVKFSRWIASNMHGDMKYLERFSPDLTVQFPWASSVIFYMLPYPQIQHQVKIGYGWISAYAIWRDYHRVFDSRLRKICQQLKKKFPKHRFQGYADAAPVLEKALAKNLSENLFQGKNTLLIHKELGSYFLLGEILTSLQLPKRDRKVTNMRCGACTQCVTICPTAAIKEGYLDSKVCISYLTIEHKAHFDIDQIKMVGNWLFGCDICQTCCPFNHKLAVRSYNGFKSEESRLIPYFPVLAALNMNEAEFTQRFTGTPVMRSKRSGFVRNAIAVAANQDIKSFKHEIMRLADEQDPVIALTAQNALRVKASSTLVVLT